MKKSNFNYDLIVIGGGSGGISCALQSAKLEYKVAIADFAKPSPLGKTWKLGGTCANVGCVPKKLFHYAALLGAQREDAQAAGWNIDTSCSHNWDTMVEMVKSHIQLQNAGYEKELKSHNIEYFDAYASFQDAHTLKTNQETKKGPYYPENLIKSKAKIQSSDDIFSSSAPNKTLIVGGSYIALETASFLSSLGFPVTVLVRSIFLRGFDQQMANKVAEYIGNKGVRFLRGFIPLDAVEREQNKIEVSYQRTDGSGEIKKEFFDTVIAATGRVPKIEDMNLEAVGISISKANKKIVVSPADETNIPGIYAIGDIAEGRPELAPPAKLAGKLLAERLFNNSVELMDYNNIATSVFTEVEYAFVGLSEEDAIKKFGEENIEVYHTHFKPLEWNYYFDREDNCYTKIIVNRSNKNRLLGMHYFGPNAGEIIQGYAVAFKMGITLKNLKETVGIHPTCSEEIVGLDKTKREDPDAKKTGC